MEQEKIASRLILADGTTFNIGTVGVVENVAVKLSAPTSEDWASMKVVVQNITQATSEEYALSAFGECKFSIPMGNVYSIVYPVLSNYKQPVNATFTATLASRSVEYVYSAEEVLYEQINISAYVVGAEVSLLDGEIVTIKTDSGLTYAETFTNGSVVLRVPYGEHYRIYTPNLDGFTKDGLNLQFNSGIPSRFIRIHYSEGLLGFFGIDDDGNQYSVEQIEAMAEDERGIIKYIGYNDSTLAVGDRGDGTQGCGVMFSVDNNTVSKQWASANVEFDSTRLPLKSNIDLASKDFASSKNTHSIITIGEELDITTPAASYCDSQIATVGGITRKGYLLAFGVLYRMVQNKTQLDELYLALGKTAPAIHSGRWWSSCQSSAAGAVYLSNGGFGTNGRTNSNPVLVGFDL
jgi:hypothetical protein